MFSLATFARLRATASMLHLGLADTCKWAWSHYRSRLPVRQTAREDSLTISIQPKGFPRFPVCIRTNGVDYGVVEEIFLRDSYPSVEGDIRTILDLGGNIGAASLLFSLRYPAAQICTVEPVPENLAILNRNMKLNQVRTQVIPAAVAAKDGETSFYLSSDPQQHTMSKDVELQQLQKIIEVDTVTVPSLMTRMGWQKVDLLKIDIEGGECAVLGGQPAWLHSVGAIVGEGHIAAGYDLARCRRDLEPMGFEVTRLSSSAETFLFLAVRNPRQS